jgi:hypothetical protein
MHQSQHVFLFDLPGRYRIRVQGRLSASWSSRLSDMVLTVRQLANQQPVTTLTGELRDQTAQGLDWLWPFRAVLMDLSSLAASGCSNRNRIPAGYPGSTQAPPAGPTTPPAA